MSKARKIVCLDFDGVIHSYTSGWQGVGVVSDPPMPGAIWWIAAHCVDLDLAIYSSRSKSIRGRLAMKRWLHSAIISSFAMAISEGRLPPDPFVLANSEDPFTLADAVMGRLRWPWFKPPAFLTIDDRALRFEGSFPTLAEIEAFRPWKVTI